MNSSSVSVLLSPTPDRGSKPIFAGGFHSPRIILVQPQGGANVGAACRAMKNMGARDLTIVAGAYDRAQARTMAVHAGDLLHRALHVDTIEEALAGCGVVVGTTARSGPYGRVCADIREVARELVAGEPVLRPFALVFGREDRGLSNREAGFCHRLAEIPSTDDYRSVNLAQAVMVCVYEIRRARLDAAAARHLAAAGPAPTRVADAGELEAAFVQLQEAFLEIGFLSEANPGVPMATLRDLIGRAAPDEREVRILRGLARQIKWYGSGGSEIADAKRRVGGKLR